MTKTLVKEEQPLVKRLPMKKLHELFGICFDKKDTYTVTPLSKEDFNGKPITISSVLKNAKIRKDNPTQKVIVFSYDMWGTRPCVAYFDLNYKGAVGSYGECYSKIDITENLRCAVEIVVIETDTKSLRYPKKHAYFEESRNFNDDFSLCNRVKIMDEKYSCYNPETEQYDLVRVVKESEIRKRMTVRDITVQFIGTGKELNLRMTWGRNDSETWDEVIDKSGYNRKARLIHNRFALQDLKANKIRKRVEEQDFSELQGIIAKTFETCKNEISFLLTVLPIRNVGIANEYLRKLELLHSDYTCTCSHIVQVNTESEYIGYTLDIPEDLQKTKKNAESLLNQIRASYMEHVGNYK